MQLNQAARELIFKVVYYGPGMAGKTTNLAHLQAKAPPGTASQLATVDIHSERTLHFDLLAADLGQIQGHNVRVEFHTVPGQSYYAATRRQLLVGSDAVVFVADSRREALDENIASMNEMLDNLRQLGMPSQIPIVLQYNKQDLPTAVRPEQLNPLMNVRNWPSRGACAASGEGVSECAADIMAMLREIAAQTELPEATASAEPRSWLISCHRCQAMLEVPDAAIGSIYTCGVCNSALEVIDPDRGLTRQPQAGRSPVAIPPAQLNPQATQTASRQVGDPSDYAMRTLPVQQEFSAGESALQRAQGTTPARGAAISGDFPLAGWEVISFVDESPQGRRLRVKDGSSNRTCRAMVLSQGMMAQPGYADGIEPYVRLAGPLKHPHILPLLEMRPAGDTVVLLSADMPEHEPLGVVLGRRRALAPPHAMGILRQVVLALEDAARQGVVHGWLRPECILISPDGTVLVDEFAVPKNHRYLVRELAGASAATEYYLAPEHLGEDARSDLRSDMFLCGALLYRMITGEGLVTGYNAHEALHKLMAGGGKPLRSVGNTVSRDLDLFYRQLTALNRGERFESYRQLVEVLDRFGGGAKRQNLRLTQPISAPPGSRAQTTPGSGTYQRSATGTHQRSGTGVHNRPGTGNWRTPTGPIAAPQRRATGEISRPPQRRSGGGMGVVVVIVAILAMVGAVAYVATQRKPPVPQPAPPKPAEAVPGPAPAPPATPPRQATASTIGSVPPEQQRPEVKPTPPIVAAKPAEPVPTELTPAQRRDLLNRITDLVLEERFQQALTLAEQLPTAEERQTQYQQVLGKRDSRRQDIEARSRTAPDLSTIQAAVRPALEGVWGMPGDREWARGLIDQAEARLAGAAQPAETAVPAQPAATAPVIPPVPVEPIQAAPAPAPAVETPGDPAFAVLSALAKGDPQAAQAAAASVPESQPDGRALRLAVASAAQRTVLLDRVAKAHSAKLRITHPTTRESVDLVAASPEGAEVSAPGGAISSLSWSQIGARDLGRLLADAAAAPGAKVEDHACALTNLIIGGDAVLATVHLRRIRPQLTPEQAADLDALVGIGRRADAQMLLARAADAQKAGSAKALAECLVELRKPERSALPNVAAVLPRLEASLKELQDGKAAGPARLADRVAFDTPADLAQFPDSNGTWQVAAGTATNVDVARLARRDMASVKSVQLILTPSSRRGSTTIEFKGLKLVFDLLGGQFTTQVADKLSAAKPCTVVERVPNTVYLAYNEDGNHTTVELNGQVIADLVMGDLADLFTLAVAGGAVVQIDEVGFTRAESQNPARLALRRLGWEPLGNAVLDEKSGGIQLAGLPNTPAGIGCQVPANTVGYTLDVKGQGQLRIQISGQGGNQHVDVPLTATEATRLTVRWAAGTFVVLDGNGVPLHSAPLARPVTSVSFTANGAASIALPIRPNRQ